MYRIMLRIFSVFFICIAFNLGMICFAVADTVVPAVAFFRERSVYIPQSSNQFHKAIQNHILNDLETDGLKFLIGKPHNKSDYTLVLNYAVGCPDLGQSTQCRLLVLWDLLRGDNAPVSSWQAYYPVDVPIQKHDNHFKNYRLPSKIIRIIGDDFIKSFNREILKKEQFDTVYIKPHRLSDQTTLCSADSIRHFYESAGLYVTDKAYKARFIITTKITPIHFMKQQVTINTERIILDRLTGDYRVFPIETTVEKDFLANDSYDCKQSAGITIQDIGLFIDKAP